MKAAQRAMLQLLKDLAERADCQKMDAVWHLEGNSKLLSRVEYERHKDETHEIHLEAVGVLFTPDFAYVREDCRVKLMLDNQTYNQRTELEVYHRKHDGFFFSGYTFFVWWGETIYDYRLGTRYLTETTPAPTIAAVGEFLAGGWRSVRDELRNEIETKKAQKTKPRKRASK